MNKQHWIGIDVSKATLDVSSSEGHFVTQNNRKGFFRIAKLARRLGRDVGICMEATGSYHELLATHLYDAGLHVCVENPARVKASMRSEGLRAKTDKADAAAIQRHAERHQLRAWAPKPKEIRDLLSLHRRLQDLTKSRVAESNRLGSMTSKTSEAAESVRRMLACIKAEIAKLKKLLAAHIKAHSVLAEGSKLLRSVPGIGPAASAELLALYYGQNFENARQMAAFSGITPVPKESGTSLKQAGRISRMGDSAIRATLYMPAVTASRMSLLAFATRLRENGKKGRQVIVACIRKLIHIAYGILTSATPFDDTKITRTA